MTSFPVDTKRGAAGTSLHHQLCIPTLALSKSGFGSEQFSPLSADFQSAPHFHILC